MENILISWIGGNDLQAMQSDKAEATTLGPLLSTLNSVKFSKAYFLYNYPKKDVTQYLNLIKTKTEVQIQATSCRLSSPTEYSEIYKVAESLLDKVSKEHPTDNLCILLSPGTPAMQAVWVLLGKTKYPALFYQSSLEEGVQKISIPFDISAEFLPGLIAKGDQQLKSLIDVKPSTNSAFNDIITQNPKMNELKAQASVMAGRDIPVLIYGETGTGKELFATAIHNASNCKDKAFISVNCGAIPADLIDSTLFGHIKGAFTGAIANKKGYFQEADGGTIFLDEFGDLPLDMQVRLLRVLQNGEVIPVGSGKAEKVDVKIIVATNKNLLAEISKGRFREDLFYRVAVGVLNLPPLREREGDIGLLVNVLLDKINHEAASQPGYKQKKISTKGKRFILNQSWSGNIRELYSTLLRASLWSTGDEITEIELKDASFDMPSTAEGILNRELGDNFDIQQVISQVVSHYVARAKEKSAGNKTKAAALLGLSNYQTLKNWEKKYNNN